MLLNKRNMKRTCRIFATFLFFVLIAILPAVAAGEEGNASLPSLEGRIKSKIESETKKKPDLEHCKVVVTMVYQRDADSDEWVGHVEEVFVSTADSSDEDLEHNETVAINSDADDSFAGSDEDDSTAESDTGDSRASNNIISWVLGVALIAVLLKFIFPWLKKRLPHGSTPVNNIAGRRKTSTESCRGESGSLDSRHGMGSRSDFDSTQKAKNATENITEKMESTVQNEKVESEGAVDDKGKVHETEKVETGEAKKHMEPVASLKPIVKYGQIAVLSQDELVTENDYMSDSAAGMPFEFTFSPGMEEGTYDIAGNSKPSFLNDINMIRPYVQDFEALAHPQKIITVSKGKLRKRGIQWVVIEKARIELK